LKRHGAVLFTDVPEPELIETEKHCRKSLPFVARAVSHCIGESPRNSISGAVYAAPLMWKFFLMRHRLSGGAPHWRRDLE
jgi:hypothetical protein